MKKSERHARRLKSGWNDIVVRDAVLETNLSKDEKLVLLALVSHADGNRVAGAERGVSVRRVALLASTHKDTPSKMFARLEGAGFVQVLRDPRERHADRFDLSGLPAALARALSGAEGQALSGPEGQQEPFEADPGCPSAAVVAVPPQRFGLSYTEGAKGSEKEPLKEPTTPRRRAAGSKSGFALETPNPAKVAAKLRPARPKKTQRKRTDVEVADQRAILDAFAAAVEAKTAQKPEIGSREAGAAWKLLDWCKSDGARAVGIVRGAVARDFGGSTSLVVIAADPNKYLGSAAKPNGLAPTPKQPSSGFRAPGADGE